jgi:hypothetical protein
VTGLVTIDDWHAAVAQKDQKVARPMDEIWSIVVSPIWERLR